MKKCKTQVTTAQLDKLMAEIRALPSTPVGDHLSDDEFIGYTMETLEPQQFERIDGHLASCPECTIEMKRLVEASEIWRGEQAEQRLALLQAHLAGRVPLGQQSQRELSKQAELSKHEEELIRLFAGGRSTKEIATQLAISIKTVEYHIARSMEKLGLHSRADIVRYASERSSSKPVKPISTGD